MLHEINQVASTLSAGYIDFSMQFSASHAKSQMRTQRSKFSYNLTIISLYGLFEQFIEGQIECFVRVISNGVGRYEELPKKLISTHPVLTLKYAQKNLDDRYKNPTDKLAEHNFLIKSLYDALDSESELFTVNGKVFSNHSSNFRYDLINSMFSDIGVDRVIEKTFSIGSVVDFYKNFFGLDDSPSHSNMVKKISEELLDLVLRRNRIAHGASEDNILAYSFLREKIEFINALSKAVSQVCNSVEKFHLYSTGLRNNSIYKLVKPTKVFTKMSSFGFSIKNLSMDLIGKLIYIGQVVYLERNEHVLSFKIKSIVINGQVDDIFETVSDFDFAIVLEGLFDVENYKKHVFSFCNK